MFQFILDFLRQQLMVNVPGIGALTLENDDTNRVVFTEQHDKSDLSLARYLSNELEITLEESIEWINEVANALRAELKANEEVDLPEFGKFSKGENGDVSFNISQLVIESWRKEDSSNKEKSKKNKSVVSDDDYIPEFLKETDENFKKGKEHNNPGAHKLTELKNNYKKGDHAEVEHNLEKLKMKYKKK